MHIETWNGYGKEAASLHFTSVNLMARSSRGKEVSTPYVGEKKCCHRKLRLHRLTTHRPSSDAWEITIYTQRQRTLTLWERASLQAVRTLLLAHLLGGFHDKR